MMPDKHHQLGAPYLPSLHPLISSPFLTDVSVQPHDPATNDQHPGTYQESQKQIYEAIQTRANYYPYFDIIRRTIRKSNTANRNRGMIAFQRCLFSLSAFASCSLVVGSVVIGCVILSFVVILGSCFTIHKHAAKH